MQRRDFLVLGLLVLGLFLSGWVGDREVEEIKAVRIHTLGGRLSSWLYTQHLRSFW